MEVNMDSSTWYIAGFFFILGAAIIAIIWILVVIIRRFSSKGKTASVVDPNVAEVAHLMRNVKTQDLVVEMDGKTFKSVSELSSSQQHRLSFASTVLGKWLGQPATNVSPSTEGQPASPTPETPIQESDWVPAETLPMQSQTLGVSPFITEPMPEVKPVSTSLPDVLGGIISPTPAPTSAPMFKSIAMQIDDILQAKIVGTPFEARGITVKDAPDHGVEVTLDGQKYGGVKDVPDEAVRNLIRSAVMEWEKLGKASSK
jgi:hypothetical protein